MTYHTRATVAKSVLTAYQRPVTLAPMPSRPVPEAVLKAARGER